MQDALALISNRKKEVAEDRERTERHLAGLKARLDRLEHELSRLVGAEEVIRQLMGSDGDSPPTQTFDLSGESALKDAEETVARGKPPGTPPMPEMIEEALAHSHSRGAPGLPPSGLVSDIRGRYWPEVEVTSVGPIAWRMWKRGQIGKDGSIYFRLDRDRLYPSLDDDDVVDDRVEAAMMERLESEEQNRAPAEFTEGAR